MKVIGPPVSTESYPQVADVLAAAFADDPVFGWLLPVNETRRTALRRFFTIEARDIVLPHGCTRVAETKTGTETKTETGTGIVGAALVLPPGLWRTPVTPLARHAPEFLRVFGARTPHAFLLLTALEREHPREPHYYLPYIGVHPDFHNNGIGTAMLTPILSRCDEEGLPAYLEASSPDNARLYERLGFEPIKDISPLGAPPLRLMRRPPSHSS